MIRLDPIYVCKLGWPIPGRRPPSSSIDAALARGEGVWFSKTRRIGRRRDG